jgi:G3E family GTPase
MIKFYLVTGFLGAGKTTFLKNFIRLLAPQRIHLIINEFGKAGVDGALLQDVGAVLDQINNGSIFCSCRLDKFEEALQQVLQTQPDAVIAEASGLSDPANIRHVLSSYPAISYQGSVCLADASRLEKVFSTARMCPRQIAVSSLVLLNKTDLASIEQCETAEQLILQANPAAHIERTQHGRIEPEWLAYITPVPNVEEAASARDITLQKASMLIAKTMPKEAMERCLAMLAEDTYRIKGLVTLKEGGFLVDCTGPVVQLLPWEGETTNRLTLLAGKGMPLRKAVKTAAEWYGGYILEVEV